MIAGCQLALLSTASKYNWNAVPAYTVEPARIHERGTVPDRKLAIITILRPPIDPILKLTPQNPNVFRHPADCLTGCEAPQAPGGQRGLEKGRRIITIDQHQKNIHKIQYYNIHNDTVK
jgi:hypothetical protein